MVLRFASIVAVGFLIGSLLASIFKAGHERLSIVLLAAALAWIVAYPWGRA